MFFGIGAGGVERIGVLYLPDYAFTLGDSISFWWARWFESGILGVLMPAALCFFLLQNCFSLISYDANVKSAVAPASGVAMVSGFLLLSAFTDIARDPAALLLFFLLVGIVTADARNRRAMRTVIDYKMQSSSYVEMEYHPIREKRRKKQGKEINAHEQ
jgi:cation transport ATPase